jgi:acetyl esterase
VEPSFSAPCGRPSLQSSSVQNCAEEIRAPESGKTGKKTANFRQETYKRIGDTELTLDIFEPQSKSPSRKYPAIVFFFGGGWVGGTPSQFHEQCAYLANRGMLAMSANYRVKSRNQTSPVECVKDGKSALRWIRANAEKLGIDPDRIAAGGGSAGGHVAAAVATTSGFEETGEDTSVSCVPNALVLFNPVFDNSPGGYGHSIVHPVFPAISPLHNLKPGTPPSIVFLGTDDKLIPVKTAQSYQQKMQAQGDRCDLHLFEGQAHGFFNFSKAQKFYFYRTLSDTDQFFVSLGWLEGKPTIDESLLETPVNAPPKPPDKPRSTPGSRNPTAPN